MGNCLVKRFKGNDDNDNLRKLGVLVFNVKQNSGDVERKFRLNVTEDVTLKAYNCTFRIGSGSTDYTEYTLSPAEYYTDITVSDNNGKIEVSNKYAISYIRRITTNKEIMVSVDLADCAYLGSLTTFRLNDGDTFGDIINFEKSVLLGELHVSYNSNVIGDIDVLAKGMVASGRTSGVLEIISNGVITQNGVVIPAYGLRWITFDSSLPGGYVISDTDPNA